MDPVGTGPDCGYESEATANSYENAFSYWISARYNLHRALQEFFNACQSLDDARVQQSRHGVDAQTCKDMSNHLDEEILSLSSLQCSIQPAKAALVHIRNNSVALVPINMLPLEVLSYVFILAQQYCVHDIVTQHDPQAATSELADVLSNVCTNWRKVSLNTRELWSHIDLITNIDHGLFDTLCNRAKLWVKRTRGCPLHIHLHELRGSGATDHEEIKRVLSWHLQHMVAVQLWSNSDHPFDDFPWELFGLRYFQSEGSVRRLSIENQSDYTSHIKLPDERFGYFFRHVSVLHLHGVAVPWGDYVCLGLTELQLENLWCGIAPTPSQVANILGASPGLRSLTFSNMRIELTQLYRGDPMLLPDLEVLNFRTLQPGSLRFVLPLLAPGPKPLSMSIPSGARCCFDKGVEAFFERSNVTTLFVDCSYSASWYPLPQSLRASLQVLGITDSRFPSDEEPNIISTNADNPVPHELTICPNLRELHLLGSTLIPELLFPMVAVHSIKELWLSGCRVRSSQWRSEPGGLTGPRTIHELANLMSEIVESVRQVDDYFDDPATCWDFVQ